jgi:predicted metalloprotease with PDZ domain
MRSGTLSVVSLLALAAGLLSSGLGQAQVPAPPTPPIAAPEDKPYPGMITVSVNATDLAHGIFAVHETLLVQAGPVTLLYPRWLPGAHSPAGAIDKLAGLVFTAGGKRVEWHRDPVDVYAFHVDVPEGAATLDVDFQFLSAVSTREGRVQMTPDMLSLQWIGLTLYPAGYYGRDLQVAARAILPEGFTPATALELDTSKGNIFNYKPTAFDTLADSPMIAGRYFKSFDLDPGGPARVTLDVIADKPEELEAKPEQIDAHKALVQQAYKVFGSHHYNHYDFLLSLSDEMGGNGLEHHQSSEDGTVPKYFTDWDKTAAGRAILPHEYTHSWNGKFRRPADLWTPSFNVPMRDSLLWVYEGQTQYWGFVLAARSGLFTKQLALDGIAATAATFDHRVGRSWRALEDTTNDPIIAQRRPLSWLSWQRSEDYYSEAQLVWLDADTLIRAESDGKRSLDDFAKLFFGVKDGSFVPETYTFEDVVSALNQAQPHDWAGFLKERLEGHGPGAPLDGLARGGYKLVYDDKESDFLKSAEQRRRAVDLAWSLGFVISRDGDRGSTLSEVIWDSPAFKAGLTEGTQIVAVNGDSFDADALKEVIKAAKTGTAPIELLVKAKDQYRTVRIDYHDGLRYPHLERVEGTPARLDDILEPRK